MNWTDDVDLGILMGGGWQQRILSEETGCVVVIQALELIAISIISEISITLIV